MKKCELYKKEGKNIRCLACAQRCLIPKERTGICGVRKNVKGVLYSLVYGKIAAMFADPIEKKPLYHFLPGSKTFSIGTIGCNLKCSWCQNYNISQASKEGSHFGERTKPLTIINDALKANCRSISYTYNEPLVFIEFVKDVAVQAKKRGLKNIMITNGYFSDEAFDYISDYIDAMNIDLKTFSEETYKKYCGARLKPVLELIKKAHEKEIHIEITTLIVPDINDSDEELENIAKFIASIDKNIPWHISRFFPMYKMSKARLTPRDTLDRAYEIGKKYLNHVYIGNV